uniref:Uncharacterized protein n=1 Tax=Tanacetum cinerariifolium TaxID=118510 RepID=A0A699S239_TANCI|nr:hypothetical protein [Tanacetum cinerariifolium]
MARAVGWISCDQALISGITASKAPLGRLCSLPFSEWSLDSTSRPQPLRAFTLIGQSTKQMQCCYFVNNRIDRLRIRPSRQSCLKIPQQQPNGLRILSRTTRVAQIVTWPKLPSSAAKAGAEPCQQPKLPPKSIASQGEPRNWSTTAQAVSGLDQQ